MGHLELNGFEAHRGYIMDHGAATSPYRKFDKVFSGHYHQRSTRENITYLGNPYQIYWNDYNCKRGFHIFDTETKELEFIPNPYEIYSKIYYNEDQLNSSKFNYADYTSNFIKIIVEKKTDPDKFEFFISQLYAAGVHEIKVIEDPSFEQDLNEEIDIEKEDTLTILEKYVDDIEYSDKPALKSILKILIRGSTGVSLMYILQLQGKEQEGAYAVQASNGKVVYMFLDKDDALRYAGLTGETMTSQTCQW